MPNRDRNSWSASEILEEAISTEKHLTALYNNAANEAKGDKVRQDFLNILMDEHQLKQDIFSVMLRRGLYQPQQAEAQDIASTQQKFTHTS